jgi:hypothetical protein
VRSGNAVGPILTARTGFNSPIKEFREKINPNQKDRHDTAFKQAKPSINESISSAPRKIILCSLSDEDCRQTHISPKQNLLKYPTRTQSLLAAFKRFQV